MCFIEKAVLLIVLYVSHCSCVLQAKPLLQLALADFLASAVLMSTIVTNFLSYDTLPVKTGEKLCNYGLPLSLVRNNYTAALTH